MKSPPSLHTLVFLALIPLMTSHASGAEDGDKGDDVRCEKKISAQGRPSTISAIAGMNAVRQWVEFAKQKFGPDYSMWHNASEKNLDCERKENSQIIVCFAKASPCKSHISDAKTAKAKTPGLVPRLLFTRTVRLKYDISFLARQLLSKQFSQLRDTLFTAQIQCRQTGQLFNQPR